MLLITSQPFCSINWLESNSIFWEHNRGALTFEVCHDTRSDWTDPWLLFLRDTTGPLATSRRNPLCWWLLNQLQTWPWSPHPGSGLHWTISASFPFPLLHRVPSLESFHRTCRSELSPVITPNLTPAKVGVAYGQFYMWGSAESSWNLMPSQTYQSQTSRSDKNVKLCEVSARHIWQQDNYKLLKASINHGILRQLKWQHETLHRCELNWLINA